MKYLRLPRFVTTVCITTLLASPSTLAETKRFILLGPTGVGKTTLINAIYNAATDNTQFDDYRYISQINREQSSAIPPDSKQLVQNDSNAVIETVYTPEIPRTTKRGCVDSDTGAIIGYRFQPNIAGWNMDDDLEIIDAPGLDDTGGEHITRQITANINQYLTDHPDSLHAIGIVFNEQETRNRSRYSKIFAQLNRLFCTSEIDEQLLTIGNFSTFDNDVKLSTQEIIEHYFTEIKKDKYYSVNLSYLAHARMDKKNMPARKLQKLKDNLNLSQENIRTLLREINQIDKKIRTTDFQNVITASNQDAHTIFEYTDLYLQHQHQNTTLTELHAKLKTAQENAHFVRQHLTKEVLQEHTRQETKTIYVKKMVEEEIEVPTETRVPCGRRKIGGSNGWISSIYKGKARYETLYKTVKGIKKVKRMVERDVPQDITQDVTEYSMQRVTDWDNKARLTQLEHEIHGLQHQRIALVQKINNYHSAMVRLQVQIRNPLRACYNNVHARKMLQNREQYSALVEQSLLEAHTDLSCNAIRKQHMLAQIKKLLA